MSMFSRRMFSSSSSTSTPPPTSATTNTTTSAATPGGDDNNKQQQEQQQQQGGHQGGGPLFQVTSKDQAPVHPYPPKPTQGEELPVAGDSVITLISGEGESAVASARAPLGLNSGGLNRVREYRNIKVGPGGKVLVEKLPITLEPTSVRFQSLTDPDARVAKQTFKKHSEGAESTARLLLKNIGQLVRVVNVTEKISASGVLKAVTSDSILIIADDKGKAVEPSEGTVSVDKGVCAIPLLATNVYTFPNIPPTVFSSNLDWTINSKVEEHLAEISYTCTGMSWRINYNGLLNSDYTSLHLTGWYSLANSSGVDFNSAKVVFVSKTRDTSEDYYPSSRNNSRMRSNSNEKVSSSFLSVSKSGPSKSPKIAKKITSRFQLDSNIEFPNGGTILEKAVDVVVPVKLFHLVVPRNLKFEDKLDTEDHNVNESFTVSKVVSFLNNKENGLGISTPAGNLMVSISEEDDAILDVCNPLAFRLNNPVTLITLSTVESFTVWRKRTEFHVDSKKRTMRETFDISLSNQSNVDINNLVVEENIYRWIEWEVTGSAVSFQLPQTTKGPSPFTDVTCEKHELKANRVAFHVPVVPRNTCIVLTYTAVYLNF